MATDKEERWYVQFDSGDVTLMTLDEIQEAFEAGRIHANTYMIEVGETEWKTLSIVAGLDDEDDSSEDELTPASIATAAPAAPAPSAYTAPSALAAYAAPAAQRGHGAQFHSPGVQTVPAMRAPVAAAVGGGWPPVAAAPQSVAPAARSISSAPPSYQSPYSMMPVVADLDIGLDGRSFKSGRKTAIVAALFALPAIGGGIYALAKLDAPPTLPPVAAAAAAPAAMPRPNSWSSPAATTPPSTPTPAPTPAADSGSSDSATGRLSEDMKKALLANDTARTEKKKAARSAAPARKSGKKGDVFKAGGAASDPLNSKL